MMKMFFAALALMQTQTQTQTQMQMPTGASDRAEPNAVLALRRATDGRLLAQRFICQDETRLRRLQLLDERMSDTLRLFALRFGHSWNEETELEAARQSRRGLTDLGRKDDCRLRDAYAAGVEDYENGLRAVQVAIDAYHPD
jgi:hypothetical protein